MKTRRIPGITKEDASTAPVPKATAAESFYAEMKKFIECVHNPFVKANLEIGLNEYKARHMPPTTEVEKLAKTLNTALGCEGCRHFTDEVAAMGHNTIRCEVRGWVNNARCSSFISEDVVDYSYSAEPITDELQEARDRITLANSCQFCANWNYRHSGSTQFTNGRRGPLEYGHCAIAGARSRANNPDRPTWDHALIGGWSLETCFVRRS